MWILITCTWQTIANYLVFHSLKCLCIRASSKQQKVIAKSVRNDEKLHVVWSRDLSFINFTFTDKWHSQANLTSQLPSALKKRCINLEHQPMNVSAHMFGKTAGVWCITVIPDYYGTRIKLQTLNWFKYVRGGPIIVLKIEYVPSYYSEAFYLQANVLCGPWEGHAAWLYSWPKHAWVTAR